MGRKASFGPAPILSQYVYSAITAVAVLVVFPLHVQVAANLA